MDAIVNNPFKILGLNPDATKDEIAERVSELIKCAEHGQRVDYDTDLNIFGEIDRSALSIYIAAKKLDDVDLRKFYQLFCFQISNELDKIAFITIKNDFSKIRDVLRLYYNALDTGIFDSEEIKTPMGINFSEQFFDIFQSITQLKKSGSDFTINTFESSIFSPLKLYVNTKQFLFNKNLPFSIEFIIEFVSGDNNDFAGIIVGDDYTIQDCGCFRIGFKKYGLYIDYRKGYKYIHGKWWEKSVKMNEKGPNHLHVSFLETCFHIWINNKEKYIFSFDEIIKSDNYVANPRIEKKQYFKEHAFIGGDGIGFYVSENQVIKISSVEFNWTNWRDFVRMGKITEQNVINFKNLALLAIMTYRKPNMDHIINPWGIQYIFYVLNSEYINNHLSFDELNYIDSKKKLYLKTAQELYKFAKPNYALNSISNERVYDYVQLFNRIYNSSEEVRSYFLFEVVGHQINEIKRQIHLVSETLISKPGSDIYTLGAQLIDNTYSKYLYITKAAPIYYDEIKELFNELSNILLLCSSKYFDLIRNNSSQVSEYEEINKAKNALLLNKYACFIAVDGSVRKRAEENHSTIKKWIIEAETKIKIDSEQKSKSGQSAKNNNKIPSSDKHKQSQIISIQRTLKKIVTTIIGIAGYFIIPAVILLIISLFDGSESGCRSKQVTISQWKGNMLESGASPYDNFFGAGIYNYNSESWLLFKNGNSTDAIVCLENVWTGRTIRNAYIQAGSNYRMSNLPDGLYKVKVFYGSNWNPNKTLSDRKIIGAFDSNLSYSISDKPDDLIKVETREDYSGITYTTGEITLYTVSYGNMQQRKIDSNEFFK